MHKGARTGGVIRSTRTVGSDAGWVIAFEAAARRHRRVRR